MMDTTLRQRRARFARRNANYRVRLCVRLYRTMRYSAALAVLPMILFGDGADMPGLFALAALFFSILFALLLAEYAMANAIADRQLQRKRGLPYA